MKQTSFLTVTLLFSLSASAQVRHLKWDSLQSKPLTELIDRKFFSGEKATVGQFTFKKGAVVPLHSHPNEQYSLILKGSVKVTAAEKEFIVKANEVLVIPANVPHTFESLEDGTVDLDFFAPAREDWIKGTETYFNAPMAKPATPWPNGAQLVVSISMQFEAGGQPSDAEGPFPALKLKKGELDLPKETWFNYGYTEGIPRMLDLWDKHQIKVTSHIVGLAALKHPALAKMIVDRGHEGASHGHTWASLRGLSEKAETEQILKGVRAVETVTGVRPVGFNAFWMRGTPNTQKILKRHRFLYHIDDLSRDEPFITNDGFVVIPYTLRNNDIALVEGKNFSAAQFRDQLKLEFDRLHAEGATKRRMMSISLHDRIGGSPAMVQAMDEFLTYARSKTGVVFLRKDEIARLIKDDPRTIHE